MNISSDNDNITKDKSDFISSDIIPKEKWIVALVKPDNLEDVCYRQFFAGDFYEAYDIIMTFSEKTGYNILWYKEKWKCGSFYNKIMDLESFCTFCNIKFNNREPIVCSFINDLFYCRSSFCSFECRDEHIYLLHVRKM